MDKTICFIGGIHGVGKTTITAHLSTSNGWLAYKQKYLMTDVAKGLGFQDWRDSAHWFDGIVEIAAELLVARLKKCNASVALIDCHYAIRVGKALRPNQVPNKEQYIPDLDWRFIQVLADSGFHLKFALLSVDVDSAMQRCQQRSGNSDRFEYTHPGLTSQYEAEYKYYSGIVDWFAIQPADRLELMTTVELMTAVSHIDSFIKKPS